MDVHALAKNWLENADENLLWLFASLVVGFFLGLLAFMMLLYFLPVDFFCHSLSLSAWKKKFGSVWGPVIFALKNLFGALLLIAGVLMLFGPGQGVLSIVVGLSLTDLSFKRRLKHYIAGRSDWMSFLDRLRARLGKEKFWR